MKKHCKQCKKILYGRNKDFCSRICRGESQKLGKWIICKTCEKEIRLPLFRLRKGAKFCGINCYGAWRRTITLSKEHKRRIGIAGKGRIVAKETREKIRQANMGKTWSEEKKKKMSMIKQGVKDKKTWKGFKNSLNRRDRLKFQREIQKQIFQRDNYTCQICEKKGGILHVDHIQSWSEYIELRFSMKNLRTLCRSCHYLITFGKIMPLESKWGISFMPHNEKLNHEEKGA